MYQGTLAKAPPCPERKTPLPMESSSSSWNEEAPWTSVEDRRRRGVAFEEAAKKMLRYLEDSEDLKVGVSQLKEQLGISHEAGMTIRQIAQQTMNESGQKILHIVKQGEEEVSVASLARWKEQVRCLVRLEKLRNDMRREV